MAGYRPQGVSVPGSFTRGGAASGTSSTFKQRPQDRLCTITGYDASRGIIFVTDDENQQKLEAVIDPKTTERMRNKEQAGTGEPRRWVGYRIDSGMEENLPIGDKVVLEKSITTKKINVGGEEKRLVECSYLHHITTPDPAKTFRAIITFSSYQKKISNVQSWADRAIGTEEADQASLDEIVKELDDNKLAYDNKENRPGLGVQFRTIVPKPLEPGKEEKDRQYEVIDSSPPFDWVQAVKDSAGNVISAGHPLTGAKFDELLGGYGAYIFGSDAEGDQPAVAPKFDEQTMAGVKIEVMTYVNYLASTMSTSMVIPDREFDPIYRIAHAQTKYAQDDTSFVTGKNWAVKGILSLSADKAPKAKGEDWVSRDLAVRLYPNALTMNVHRFVATSTGNRVVVHPAIDRVRDDNDYVNNTAAQPAASAPAATGTLSAPPSQAAARPASAPLQAPSADPFGAVIDPFTVATQSAPAPAAPLQALAADPFNEAAAAAAAAPAPAPAAVKTTPAPATAPATDVFNDAANDLAAAAGAADAADAAPAPAAARRTVTRRSV